MKRFVQMSGVFCLFAVLTSLQAYEGTALGQVQAKPALPAANGSALPPKNRVQGYTRTNRKTGELERVRSYRRRPPSPKPIAVRPYMRNGKPVQGYDRRPPAPARPAGSAPKTQSRLWPSRSGIWQIRRLSRAV